MKMKWYAGGGERGQEAVSLTAELVEHLNNEQELPLKQLLLEFHQELSQRGQSIPFILSRMNVAIAKVMHENQIVVDAENEQRLKALVALSQIRYGY